MFSNTNDLQTKLEVVLGKKLSYREFIEIINGWAEMPIYNNGAITIKNKKLIDENKKKD